MNRIAIVVVAYAVVLFSLIARAQDTSQSPQVLQATYGAGDAQMDVTQQVQAAVANGQTTFRADNRFFGKDPAFGKVKTLSVTFVQGGVQHQTSVREGEQFRCPLRLLLLRKPRRRPPKPSPVLLLLLLLRRASSVERTQYLGQPSCAFSIFL